LRNGGWRRIVCQLLGDKSEKKHVRASEPWTGLVTQCVSSPRDALYSVMGLSVGVRASTAISVGAVLPLQSMSERVCTAIFCADDQSRVNAIPKPLGVVS
jgi:hypothetical protein